MSLSTHLPKFKYPPLMKAKREGSHVWSNAIGVTWRNAHDGLRAGIYVHPRRRDVI